MIQTCYGLVELKEIEQRFIGYLFGKLPSLFANEYIQMEPEYFLNHLELTIKTCMKDVSERVMLQANAKTSALKRMSELQMLMNEERNREESDVLGTASRMGKSVRFVEEAFSRGDPNFMQAAQKIQSGVARVPRPPTVARQQTGPQGRVGFLTGLSRALGFGGKSKDTSNSTGAIAKDVAEEDGSYTIDRSGTINQADPLVAPASGSARGASRGRAAAGASPSTGERRSSGSRPRHPDGAYANMASGGGIPRLDVGNARLQAAVSGSDAGSSSEDGDPVQDSEILDGDSSKPSRGSRTARPSVPQGARKSSSGSSSARASLA